MDLWGKIVDKEKSNLVINNIDLGQVSDGYHTFEELYEHRIELYLALCRVLGDSGPVWKSRLHSDGTSYPGWFVLGIGRDSGQQITYHLPESYWDKISGIRIYDKAPEWDGHSSSDVLERLRKLGRRAAI